MLLSPSGNSLVGDDIHDGDFILLDTATPIIDGEIYAVSVPDGVCAKHYWRQGDKVRLTSSNPEYVDLLYKAEEVEIIGHIIHSLRGMR